MSTEMAANNEVERPVEDRKDKSGKKSRSRKRHRETTDTTEAEGTERKHKKSKSHVSPEDASHIVSTVADQSEEAPAPTPLPVNEDGENGENGDSKKEKKSRKSKKDKKRHESQNEEKDTIESTVIPNNQDEDAPDATHKKKKEKKKRHKEGKKPTEADHPEPMDIDSAPAQPKTAAKVHSSQSDNAFPFFTQTVSQYLPLFPQGMVEPIEGYAEQHLRPLLNRYVPAFRGVLLAYRNPRIGEAPGKGSLTETSEMEETALLESVDEYAVGLAWLTVEADLFCPKRGSWMEGSLNLQSEGFIGVICFGMFNASIEASRLPSGWKWIDLLSSSKDKGKRQNGKIATEAEAQLPTPEPQDETQDEAQDGVAHDENEDNGTNQAHSTGYWVDESASKISGKLRFRIKNYEVGSIGDYGYLSIEGTMLDEEAERAKVADDIEMDRRRKLKHGGVLRKSFKHLPEFSMTKFGKDDEQDDDILRSIGLKSKRPNDGTNAAAAE